MFPENAAFAVILRPLTYWEIYFICFSKDDYSLSVKELHLQAASGAIPTTRRIETQGLNCLTMKAPTPPGLFRRPDGLKLHCLAELQRLATNLRGYSDDQTD